MMKCENSATEFTIMAHRMLQVFLNYYHYFFYLFFSPTVLHSFHQARRVPAERRGSLFMGARSRHALGSCRHMPSSVCVYVHGGRGKGRGGLFQQVALLSLNCEWYTHTHTHTEKSVPPLSPLPCVKYASLLHHFQLGQMNRRLLATCWSDQDLPAL